MTPYLYPGFKHLPYFLTAEEYRFPREVEEKTLGARQFPLWSGPDSVMHACHNPSLLRAMLTGSPYPIKGLYITGQNILATRPGSRDWLEAMLKMNFIANACHRLDPTSEYADVVLPKTTTLEEDMVDFNGAIPGLQVFQRAIEPLGEAWDDHKICSELLRVMVSKGIIEKSYITWNNCRAFCDVQLENTGVTFDELREKGFIEYPVDYAKLSTEPFPTPTGKFEFYSTLLEKFGHDPLPNYVEPPHNEQRTPFLAQKYPLILLTGTRKVNFHHSRFLDQEWVRKVHPYPEIEIHPEAAQVRGINDGDMVWIETPRSRDRTKMKAKITRNIHPKVVAAPMGWWLPERDGPDHALFEVNINAALSYWEPWDPVIGVPDVCGGELCEISKA